MKKLFGLFSTTLLATLMCVGLTNRVKEKAPETAAPRQTLEVRDVLRKGAEDGEGNVVEEMQLHQQHMECQMQRFKLLHQMKMKG